MEDGPPVFPPGFTCPAVLWIQMAAQAFRVQDSHLLRLDFPFHSTKPLQYRFLSEPRKYYYSRFGLFRVRSPLLTESQLISLPRLLRCFSSGGSLHIPMYSVYDDKTFLLPDCSIRKSADQSLLTAPRSLSQLVTSFFGSRCQGIPLVLFVA